jgi:hypothetical protein
MDDPVRAITDTLNRQIRYELLQPIKIATDERFVLLAPYHQRWRFDDKQ